MSFAKPNEDNEEEWLEDPNIESPVRDWREAKRKRNKGKHSIPRPIKVGNTKRFCNGCSQKAAVELFRNDKCLACQVAEFLGPL